VGQGGVVLSEEGTDFAHMAAFAIFNAATSGKK
jgi:hypothetical protein